MVFSFASCEDCVGDPVWVILYLVLREDLACVVSMCS
jgi:hypothetical protein